jgi:predicted dienelactone hydrolase
MRTKRFVAPVHGLIATALLAAACLLLSPTAAGADTEYRKGPAPTAASVITAGTFAVSSVTVPTTVTGFGGGTIYYPTDTSQGTYGGVAFAPGFLASSTNYTWVGPRLASHGFVVIMINTLTRLDQPPSRGDQLLAALTYLTTSSSVANRVDPNRLAVAGHSMGGGGTLEAALDRPSLQAAVPLQPWNQTKSWTGIGVPTMIIGAEADTTADVVNHAEPFYESIPASAEKGYVELNDAEHRVGTTADNTQAKFMLVWLKRYVDNDTRYEQFICPAPAAGGAIEEYRGTCPG